MSDIYENPLCTRYSGPEMKKIFSPDTKFRTWRKLWIALAESERELGLGITEEQIAELRAHVDDIDYERARKYEHEVRHDVMAHVKTYGDACPGAKGIIHLGATSCYVGDNTDIILMKRALGVVRRLLLGAISAVADFAEKYKDLPTLAYTHFQAAQPTTLGKRATLWLQDLISDLELLDFESGRLRLLGCKGTTGTAASFYELFDGDTEKIKLLEKKIAEKMGMDGCYPVSGQTYSRKVDYNVLSVLSSIAQSAAKFSNDIRLLAHLKEFDEPFETGQIGSSAMAYKRNPMRSERIASLCRYVMIDTLNPAITAATQWFERTLDDSANKRLSVAEAFLATDAILNIYMNITEGIVVYERVIARRVMEKLPFMATENILMESVKRGGDRQELHEALRVHSHAAAARVKLEGGQNDLLDRIAADPLFPLSREELEEMLDPRAFIGCCPSQVTRFLKDTVQPVVDRWGAKETLTAKLEV